MTLRPVITVFRKEMVDHLRDRRSILVAMIYPLLGPLLVGLMFVFVGGSMRVNDERVLAVPIEHSESAPELIHYLERQGALVTRLAGGARTMVAGGRMPFVVILPEQPAPNGEELRVKLITNPSRVDSMIAASRVNELLNKYKSETLDQRLSAAGVSPATMNILNLEQENVGRAAGPAVILLTMIPPFLIFTLFTGGVHVLLDSTSGERERGGLEALLMNPVTRAQVLTGKLATAIVFTLMALASQIVGFWGMLHVVPQASLGLITPPSTLRLLIVVSVCLPIVVLAVAFQLLISAVTRSMKEAQTYLGLLPLVPGLAGIVLALSPVNAQPLLALIPTFGQTLLMGQLVRSEAISALFFGITGVATLLTTVFVLWLGFRLYEREEILFPA